MATHISKLKGKYKMATSAPSAPQNGDMYFDITRGALCIYDSANTRWLCHIYTSTSVSTSSSTSVSTSSSTTSVSTTTTLSTSTSSSTTI